MWAILGKLAIFYILLRLLLSVARGIYSCFLAHTFRLNLNLTKTGQWAVVTGATDGIGKAYALELAKRGLNILLISRTASKLQAVAAEIKDKFPVETRIFAADFTKNDIYDGIGKELKSLDIGVLVNNVGMSYDYPEYLTKYPDVEKFSEELLNINVKSVNRMTLLVLPGMEERKRGLIINVSSFSALVPAPLLTLYAATKAYVDAFSRNLDIEVRNKGVHVQCVIPSFVSTNLSKMRPSFTVPTANTYVKHAIGTVGVENRTGGHIAHKLMIYVAELIFLLFPKGLYEMHFLSHMLQIRSKALKKKAREGKQN